MNVWCGLCVSTRRVDRGGEMREKQEEARMPKAEPAALTTKLLLPCVLGSAEAIYGHFARASPHLALALTVFCLRLDSSSLPAPLGTHSLWRPSLQLLEGPSGQLNPHLQHMNCTFLFLSRKGGTSIQHFHL